MLFSLQSTLKQIKNSLAELLDRQTLLEVCREVGHTFRERVLDPATTLHLFILQVLHGNTAMAHLPRLSDLDVSEAAYCQARQRLPLAFFAGVLQRLGGALRDTVDAEGRWRGHRTFLLDGSSFSMPDTPQLQEHFGQPGGQRPGCGFPVAHLLALFHAGTGMLIDALALPLRTHDMSQAATLHPKLAAGDVLVGDRGLCSFVHFALAQARSMFAVFRAHQKLIIDFTPGRPHASGKHNTKGMPTSRWLRSLGPMDQVVEWRKPKLKPDWMTAEQYAALPPTLEVRELRYRVTRPGYRVRDLTLTTTLLDPTAYPATALAELYGIRWRVEGHLRNLKTTMKMDVLRSKTVDGIRKELAAFALVYNLVCTVIVAAAQRQRVPPERISFIDALRWLACARPGKRLAKLKVVPYRPIRCEPRAVKRRPKEYDRLTMPRRARRLQLIFAQAAALATPAPVACIVR